MQIAQGMKLCAAACLAATLMDTSAALPGRIEYAVNFGKESASVGRFLPVGSTYWQEGKSWNQIKNETFTAPSGYEDCADIYRTYVYPTDTTAGLSAVYRFPGLTPGNIYTVRVHVAEVYFQWADCRKFDVNVNGETKIAALDPFALAGNRLYQGAYADISASADESGTLTVAFTNVKDQFNVAAIEIFADGDSLPVPAPRVCRESRGVNRLTMETRNAAYLYDVECRSGESGAARVLASGVSGLRVIDIRGTETTQYRARAVSGGSVGEWSAWTPVDASAPSSDAPILIACAEAGQAAPEGWLKDEPFRVFPSESVVEFKTWWKEFNLSWFAESERPPLLVFQLAVTASGSPLSYRFAGLDPERTYRVRIHQMEPWDKVTSGGWRQYAYHFNNALERATALTGETVVDPYILAGNAICKAAAVDYDIDPDSAGTITVTGENVNMQPYWFGFEIHPLGEVKDPNPPGLCIFVR